MPSPSSAVIRAVTRTEPNLSSDVDHDGLPDAIEARPGDLLFFYQPYVQNFPYHVMIFLGDAHVANEGAHDWVVYHTGAAPENGGTVKKVRLAVLDQHPNKRWRPLATNPDFLGFCRLKLLQQSVEE